MSNSSKDLVTANNTHNLTSVLIKIDKKYQEQIYSFINELQNLNSEVDLINNEINVIKENIASLEEELKSLNSEIKSELLYLEKLNDKFLKKASVAFEIKKLNIKDNSSLDIIDELLEEIRELEIDILQKELQKENIQLKLIPSWQKITELKSKISEIEAQKRYIESLGTFNKVNNQKDLIKNVSSIEKKEDIK